MTPFLHISLDHNLPHPNDGEVRKDRRAKRPHALGRILWPEREHRSERAHGPLYAKSPSLYVPSLKDNAIGLKDKCGETPQKHARLLINRTSRAIGQTRCETS
jgi:hypothetical protein